MGKILREKYLHWFSGKIVYITIEEVVKDNQKYMLSIWNSIGKCFNHILYLDISKNLDDIIEDLERVCQKVVILFEEKYGLYAKYENESRLEKVFKTKEQAIKEMKKRKDDCVDYYIKGFKNNRR